MTTEYTEKEYSQVLTRVLQQKLFNTLSDNAHWETKYMILQRQLSDTEREIEDLRSRYAAVQNVLKIQNQVQTEELSQQLQAIPDTEEELVDCGCGGDSPAE